MDEKEFKEIFKDAKVVFIGYYKYNFKYSGKHKGYDIKAYYSGCANDIYYHEVDTNPIALFNNVFGFTDVYIYDRYGKEIYKQCNW